MSDYVCPTCGGLVYQPTDIPLLVCNACWKVGRQPRVFSIPGVHHPDPVTQRYVEEHAKAIVVSEVA